MSHEFQSGFVGEARKSWHGLAKVLPKSHGHTEEELIVLAGLDWDVIQRDIQCTEITPHGVQVIEVPGFKVNLRSDTLTPLGVVTDQWKPYQHREFFTILGQMARDGLVEITSGLCLKQGQIVCVQARYADDIEVKEGDKIVPYLTFATGHHGKMSNKAVNTPIRTECWNTVQAAGIREGHYEPANGYSIPHIGDVRQKMAIVMDTIKRVNVELGITIEAYRKMANEPASDTFVRDLAKEVFDQDYQKATKLIAKFRQREEMADDIAIKAETKAAIADLEKILAKESSIERRIVSNFHEGPGARVAGLNKWGAFNAVTEHIDHGVRGNANTRLSSSWFGPGAGKRAKAFELITASMGGA